ncbi:hypothetical protein AYO21_08126 [Fonsecaea monophora]|uniref:Uncharacterized protein n=1 Tax=Fonsecaea monophora TaxID=254056 RepID=A0A177F2V3_9EURO|nr:hypothetical protein AYO21_08126 [Fonsecaea monophora]KAH0837217.1 hypothetical protein FOPE_04760 [Fonsecaea pedrosoi]OAG37642.1 hypothetical protein AYO21_08126 [Fonsecaea monophora]
MCIWDLAVFQCGHNGSFTRRDGGCALPTSACEKELVNAIRYSIPWNCPDCAQRLARGIPPHPEDHIHPLARSVQQPMRPVALPPQAVSRRAMIRKSPSPVGDGYDSTESAEYTNYPGLSQKRMSSNISPTKITKRQRISRNRYSSDAPTMLGRLENIAQDLNDIAMPSAMERKSGVGYSPTTMHLHGTVQDVSEIPVSLVPGLMNTSPTRRRNDRSPTLVSGAGITKRRKPSNPPRRISPTQPRAPYADANAPFSPSTYTGYAAASQAAARQKQTAARTYNETRDDVERMIETGHHSRDEIMATAKFAMLNHKDQEQILWQYEKTRRTRENQGNGTLDGRKIHNVRSRDEGKREGHRKRGGCAVM